MFFNTPLTADRFRRQPLAVAVALVSWIGAIGAGWGVMADYDFQSDRNGLVQARLWPADAKLARSADAATLLVFLHPKCPCSQATLAELERIGSALTAVGPAATQYVVFSTPTAVDDNWLASPLVARSRQLTNAEIIIDRGGAMTARFGATGSGTVMLYDAAGNRVYAGGITASRGHEGPNVGADAVATLLAGRQTNVAALPVFGCRLVAEDIIPVADLKSTDSVLNVAAANTLAAIDGRRNHQP